MNFKGLSTERFLELQEAERLGILPKGTAYESFSKMSDEEFVGHMKILYGQKGRKPVSSAQLPAYTQQNGLPQNGSAKVTSGVISDRKIIKVNPKEETDMGTFLDNSGRTYIAYTRGHAFGDERVYLDKQFPRQSSNNKK